MSHQCSQKIQKKKKEKNTYHRKKKFKKPEISWKGFQKRCLGKKKKVEMYKESAIDICCCLITLKKKKQYQYFMKSICEFEVLCLNVKNKKSPSMVKKITHQRLSVFKKLQKNVKTCKKEV